MRFQKAPKSMRSQTKTWHYCGRGLTDAFKRVVVDQGPYPARQRFLLRGLLLLATEAKRSFFVRPARYPGYEWTDTCPLTNNLLRSMS